MRIETYVSALMQTSARAYMYWSNMPLENPARTIRLFRQQLKFASKIIRMADHKDNEIRTLKFMLEIEHEEVFVCPRCGSEVSKLDTPIWQD